MSSFALFRHPYSDHCTLLEQRDGEPMALRSWDELSSARGFVVAPFVASAQEPPVVIRPDRVERVAVEEVAARCQEASPAEKGCSLPGEREAYGAAFGEFHRALCAGEFQKLVLARSTFVKNGGGLSPLQLFQAACRQYPRVFVALVSTPQSGVWLTATPEILLEGTPQCWRTMALAGTMTATPEQEREPRWAAKDQAEQRHVARYIGATLQALGLPYTEEPVRTVRAAHLLHLRSDFTFATEGTTVGVGQLVGALHPTPAVCGLPKEEARDFILSHEPQSRHYYSGFMGPLNLESTSLYVSLRCMRMGADGCQLFAGGGLLPDSVEEREWQETESKLLTMRRLLSGAPPCR